MSPPQRGTSPAGERGTLSTSATTPTSTTEKTNRRGPEALHRKVITGQTCQFCFREANWKTPTGHLVCTQCRLSEIRDLLAKVDEALGLLRFELCEVGALYIEEAS